MQRIRTYGDLAELIRLQRKQQAISQEDMAASLAVAHTTLARLEKESGTKTLRMLFETLDALGIALYAQEPGTRESGTVSSGHDREEHRG